MKIKWGMILGAFALLIGAHHLRFLVSAAPESVHPGFTITLLKTTQSGEKSTRMFETISFRSDGSEAHAQTETTDGAAQIVAPPGGYIVDRTRGEEIMLVPQVKARLTFAARQYSRRTFQNGGDCSDAYSPSLNKSGTGTVKGLPVIVYMKMEQLQTTTLWVAPTSNCEVVAFEMIGRDNAGKTTSLRKAELISYRAGVEQTAFIAPADYVEMSPLETERAYASKTGLSCSECAAKQIEQMEHLYRNRSLIR